jgi:hypothetical protein
MLATIQKRLEAIYGLRTGHDVRDYLTTDADYVKQIQGRPVTVQETLLVRQDDEHLDISLYLDPDVVSRLTTSAGSQGHSLGDLWVALEGVSHFLYVIWNATWGHSVTLLELELQAEIDKFVATILALDDDDDQAPTRIHTHLFDDPQFDRTLDDEGLARYRQANRFAGKYCQSLAQTYLAPSYGLPETARPNLLAELRHFYRLSQSAKIRRIETGS